MTSQEFSLKISSLESAMNNFARSLTGNSEDAKDLFQETVCKAYGNIKKYELRTNFKAWIMTIMRNTFINNYRRKKFRNEVAQPSNAYLFEVRGGKSENTGYSSLRMKELDDIFAQVSEIYTVPFLMNYKGYKYEEISEHLGVPIGTVKSRIFHARRQLKEAIEANNMR